MKTTLIVIQNDTDHADAKRLIEKLMGSSDSQDRARMVAQARFQIASVGKAVVVIIKIQGEREADLFEIGQADGPLAFLLRAGERRQQ